MQRNCISLYCVDSTKLYNHFFRIGSKFPYLKGEFFYRK